jgi:L-asparaginase
VTVLAAGGTIAMRGAGTHATPALDGEALVAAVPELAGVTGLEVRSLRNLPGSQMTADDALEVARAAARCAADGAGVVVTHGTDTIEETAFLCDLLHGGDAPVVFTGAMRPGSAPGADGPANLIDAVAVAGSYAAAGLGALVAFAGELHAARAARKVDSTGPAAFGSPRNGPIGRVGEGHVEIWARPPRRPPLDPERLDARVEIVAAPLGADGALVEAALDAGAEGLVAQLLGAGHAPPAFMAALDRAAGRVPVVAVCRPERGAILHSTYGFEGSERDLRASAVIPAGALSAPAARIKLMACLGAALDADAIRAAFASDDD